MKPMATTLLCIGLSAALALAQNPEQRNDTNQVRIATRSLARLASSGGGGLLKADYDKQALPSALIKWLDVNAVAVVNAGPSPFEKHGKWGVATTNGDKLFLHIVMWPEDGKLVIPRLHNSVKKMHLTSDTTELALSPNVTDWAIELPEKPKPRDNVLPVIVLELDGPAVSAGATPPTVRPSVDGSLELHSRYSIVHGEMLRFEPQPHKNTVGYWVKEKDWAEWSCSATKAGKYEVELRYGCGQGQGGSDIEIAVGDQVLPFNVAETGGFQAWRDVKLGNVNLSPGVTTMVTAKPKKKARNAVMDIQQITLRPVD
jgi:hypothetical protein